jgi:hypothetical protein
MDVFEGLPLHPDEIDHLNECCDDCWVAITDAMKEVYSKVETWEPRALASKL